MNRSENDIKEGSKKQNQLAMVPLWKVLNTSTQVYRANAGDARNLGFDPCVGKVPGRMAWQPTPVFLPGESQGQRTRSATVHRVAKSQTRLKQLSMHTCRSITLRLNGQEKELLKVDWKNISIWRRGMDWE